MKVRTLLFLVLSCSISFSQSQQRRIYLVDKDSWAESGGFAANNGTAVGSYHASVRHISTEQIKTLNKACPALTITVDLKASDFVVVWDTKTWAETSWSGHQNEYVVYNSR
jgi:hypothetical protein